MIEIPQQFLQNLHQMKDVARDNFNIAGDLGNTSHRLGTSVESSADFTNTYKPPSGSTLG
jgi:hypothetical protein